MKINYVSKKFLAILLGGTMVLTHMMLASCSNYETNEQGEVELVKNISYEVLSEDYVITVKVKDEIKLYIADHHSGDSREYYNDVLTNKEVYSTKSEDVILISEENLMPYLLIYDMVKDSYTKEDINSLIENIKKDYYDFLIEKVKAYK